MRLLLAFTALLAFARPSPAQVDEAWYLVRVAGTPVGTASERTVTGPGGTEFQAHMSVRFTRLGTPLSMTVLTDETSLPDGRFVRSRMESTLSASTASAELDGDSLRYESRVGGSVRRVVMPWEPGAVSEAEASRRVRVWLRGAETDTTITVFDITEGTFRTTRYQRGETVRDDTHGPLTAVEEYEAGASTPSSTLWFDADGAAARTVVRQLGVEIVVERVTPEQLATIEIEPDFDIIRQSMVPCADFPRPVSALSRVTLRVAFPGTPPARKMDGPSQREVARDGRDVTLTLYRGTEIKWEAEREALAPFLKPDMFIQSDDARVRAVADSLRAATRLKGWDLARSVAMWVNRHIVHKGMEHGYASAAEVMGSRSGDCTEHSLLTVAVLRAAGVPARPVVGLVYGESEQAFVGHMWVEAYVDHWRTLDALDLDLNPVRVRVHAPEQSESLGQRDLLRAYGTVAGVSIRAVGHELK